MTNESLTATTRLGLVALLGLALFAGSVNEALAERAPGFDSRVTDVRHRAMEIQGVDIAYREAGDPSLPTIILLHGFPTSSHMFRELIPRLADRYHVVAPDFPGYGASDMPALDQFEYSFANFATIVDELLQKKGIKEYALYVMDCGAPVGFRLFVLHPERVTGFVIQNGNAYAEGLQEFWDPIKAYWADSSTANGDQLRASLLTLEATRWQWTHGIPEDQLELVSPDNWHHDQFLLDRPGNKDIQLQMFLSYARNVDEYPKWQQLFRQHQPAALIVWGKGDHIFPAAGAYPYSRDLKNLEVNILDAGHFALETHLDFIAEHIGAFMARSTR